MTAFAPSSGLTRATRPIDVRVSVHEAGHSVVALDRRIPIEFASIAIDLQGHSLGRVRLAAVPRPVPAEQVCASAASARERGMLSCEALFLAALERRQALRHARRIDRTVARHDPRGASTETTSPTPLPIKAAPRGESEDTPPPTDEIVTSITSPWSSAISTIEPGPT